MWLSHGITILLGDGIPWYTHTITEHILKDFSADKEAGSWSSVDHQSTLIWATVLDIAGHSGCRIQQNGHPQLELVGSSKRANPQSRIKDGERAGVNHNSHRFSEVRYSLARHLGMSLHFLSNRSWEITWGEAPAMLWEWGVQAVKKIGILKCKWLYYIM